METYSGILKRMGPGIGQVHQSPQHLTNSGRIAGGRTSISLIRTLVDVGDARIPKMKLTYYQDALLEEAIGHEVTLVLLRGNGLFSLSTPAGVVGPALAKVIATLVRHTLVFLVLGGLVTAFALALMAPAGIAVGLVCLLLTWLAISDAIQCWKATPGGPTTWQPQANWAPPTA